MSKKQPKVIKDQEQIGEPSLDQILKEYPPVEDEPELGYEGDDEEEEMDTFFALMPFEEKFYDNDGNFYPDGYLDENGNAIPGTKKS